MRWLSGLYGCLRIGVCLLATSPPLALIIPLAVLKGVLPPSRFRTRVTLWVVALVDSWTALVKWVEDWPPAPQFELQGLQGLKPDGRYLVLANHQAWTDILVLFYVCQGRIPFPRFFLKRVLLWLPIVGYIAWVLDFPFMYRLKKEQLRQHPEWRDRDVENTRAACAKYRQIPVSIVNFLESTRFTETKRVMRNSPYRHLLRPKSESVGLTLSSMGELLDGVLDLTIVYAPGPAPNFWNFCCARVPKVLVRGRLLAVPMELVRSDLDADLEQRKRLRVWVNGLWAQKDREIAELRQQLGYPV